MKTTFNKQNINKILLSFFVFVIFMGTTISSVQAGAVCALSPAHDCSVLNAAITLSSPNTIADGGSVSFSVYAVTLAQYSNLMVEYMVGFAPDLGGWFDSYPSGLPPLASGGTVSGLSTGPLTSTQSGFITFTAYGAEDSMTAPQVRVTVTAPAPTVNLHFSTVDKMKQFLKNIFSGNQTTLQGKTS